MCVFLDFLPKQMIQIYQMIESVLWKKKKRVNQMQLSNNFHWDCNDPNIWPDFIHLFETKVEWNAMIKFLLWFGIHLIGSCMSSETWVWYCMVEYFPKCQFILCSCRRREQSVECRSCWLNELNKQCVYEFQIEHRLVYCHAFGIHMAWCAPYIYANVNRCVIFRDEFVQFWINEICVYFCWCIKIYAIKWWLSNISFCSSLCFIWYSRHELCFASKWIDNGTK